MGKNKRHETEIINIAEQALKFQGDLTYAATEEFINQFRLDTELIKNLFTNLAHLAARIARNSQLSESPADAINAADIRRAAALLVATQPVLNCVVPDPSNAAVFVSYSHKDKEVAGELQELFHAEGVSCSLSQLPAPGTRWADKILGQVCYCRAFVFLVTDHSRKSVWCNRELGLALGLCKPVIPVLRTSTKPPPDLAHFQCRFCPVDARLTELAREIKREYLKDDLA